VWCPQASFDKLGDLGREIQFMGRRWSVRREGGPSSSARVNLALKVLAGGSNVCTRPRATGDAKLSLVTGCLQSQVHAIQGPSRTRTLPHSAISQISARLPVGQSRIIIEGHQNLLCASAHQAFQASSIA
jgi:hypothetical protein